MTQKPTGSDHGACQPAQPDRQKRILLIDDDSILRELLSLTLQLQDFEVSAVGDGRQRLAELDRSPVDLIILDMMMPVMDGLKFLHCLRTERKLDTPVLCLTAFKPGVNADTDKFASGAHDVLHKPVNQSQLMAKVEKLVG